MKQADPIRLIARILSVLLVAFFLMTSFDEPPLSLGFLMHNIPTIIILIASVIAWKYEHVGGIIFLALGLGTVFFFNVRQNPQSLIITLPFVAIGTFYLASSKKTKPSMPAKNKTL